MSVQQYLDASEFADPLYNLSYGAVLAAWQSPQCPNSYGGAPQVYSLKSGMCVTVDPMEFTDDKLAMSSGVCGPSPFLKPVKVEGEVVCMQTNNCTTVPSYPDTCLNTQSVPVRPQPFQGPGVLYSSIWAGNAGNYNAYI